MAAGESGCPGSPRLSPAQHSPLPAAHHRNFPRDEMSAGSVPEPVGKAGVRCPSLGRGVPAAWPPCPGAGCECCVPGVPLHRQVRAPSGSRCPQGRKCHGFGLILHRALFLPARLFGRDLSSVPREQPSAPRCRGEGLQWQQVKRPLSPPSFLLLFFFSAAASPWLQGASAERQSCRKARSPRCRSGSGPRWSPRWSVVMICCYLCN